VSVFRQSIIKICLSIIIFGFTIIVANTNVCANTVTKTISGQAVLTDGVEKARKESINDALGEALNNYIYGDMAVNHKFEQQIDEVILKNRNRYIKNFAIQSEHTLGELYQIELRVELKSAVIERDLKKIEKSEKLKVENLLLLFLPPKRGSSGSGLESDSHETEFSTPVLDPKVLERELEQELTLYGFTLSGANALTPELKSMMVELLDSDDGSARRDFNAAWFKGLLAGDLIIVVRAAEIREEKIVSLRKSFWHSQAEIVFIDMKNGAITYLPAVETKIVGDDYVVGMERLTRELSDKICSRTIDRLLRDYVVPGGSEERIEFECMGFRQPADFMAFRERLKSLRTVKEVSLKEFAQDFITIEIITLTPPELLGDWLNSTAVKNLNFQLQATLLPALVPVSADQFATNNPAAVPARRYLVQVVYGAPDTL